MTETQAKDWHLDRKVTIGLILTIMVQSASALWWAATLTARVDVIEKTQVEHGRSIDDWSRADRAMVERVTRMEERLSVAVDILRRLDAARDRRTEIMPRPDVQ